MGNTSTGDPAQARILDNITRLGLDAQLLALETQGFAVIKGVLSREQLSRARNAIVARYQRNTGQEIDIESEDGSSVSGQTYVPYLLYDDAVFEDILLAEAPLALISYLLGESCVLSSMGCHFKGPGGEPLLLHSDNGNGTPAPFSSTSFVANVNYALTPYSREAGALAMVPGSHKLARQPVGREMRLDAERANPNAIAMDLEPGDAVVWHGNTWHGSFARQVPGVRLNLAVYFARQFVQTQEQHKGVVPEAVLARHANNARMLRLLGAKQPYGWRQEGPDFSIMAQNPKGLFD